MPSTSFLTPLDYLDLSPASTPSTLTTRNKIDGKEKQRLSRQARKLSQILGELPQETAALAHPVKGSTPESSVPPMGLSQLHASCSRPSFSEPSTRSPRLSHIFHTVTASTMPPSLLPSVHDGSSRTGHRRRSSIISAHINQLDLTRFGLGRRDSGSTSSAHSDENAQHTDRRSLVEEALSDSSNLHSLDVTRPRNKPRWRSVYNPRPMEFEAHPRRSENSSMPAYSSKRSVSLWAKRRPSNEDQRSLANQGQKNITSGAHPPLTESERILYLRRGRKLTQVFGTVPPIALYSAPSQAEDVPATSDTVQSERTKAYLTLSSGDLRSPNSGRSSRDRSHSSLSQASDVSISPSSPPNNDVEAPREIETPSHPLPDPDEDPDSSAQGSHDRPEDCAAFRRRRLRAAKLSRFFGVAYNDLTGIGAAVPGRRGNTDGVNPRAAEEVDVRIDGPGWLSDSGGENMNDVIALLRQMPRA
jgi:hypothetical protein